MYDGRTMPLNIPGGTDRFVKNWISTLGNVEINVSQDVMLRYGSFVDIGEDFLVQQGGTLLIEASTCRD